MLMRLYEQELAEVCLEITGICPMNCLHCSGECGANSQKSLNLRQIKGVIDDLHAMGGRLLEISGGEPLACHHLPQIVLYARQQDIETVLYTSGTMLDETVARKLCQSKLEKIVFNLQGAIPSTHDTITKVEGSFSKALIAIKRMKKLGFWVGVHFVPMKPNYQEFRTLLGLCDGLGVDEMAVLRFVPQGRGLLNRSMLELSKEEFRVFTIDLIRETSLESRVRVGCPIDFRHLFDSPGVRSACNAGISKCLINPDGTVVPCPAFKQSKQHVAGNIKTSSLTTIWAESPVWDAFRDFDIAKLKEPCHNCRHLYMCRGGCIAQRVLELGDSYAAPDPKCFAFYSEVELRALA
jgi:radical SAM protein with 4Fe4S-binding SPASM domain